MARYDVYRLGDGSFQIDVQSDTLHDLNTRVVIPLMPPGMAPKAVRRLNPRFVVGDQTLVLVTQYLGTIPRAEIGRRVANLANQSDKIIEAMDVLLTGF